MSLSRLDLDGLGSPRDIAARIHELTPDLAANFSLYDLCRQLDIDEIRQVATDAYEAALLMDVNKASGSILLRRGRTAKRHRFSIGHELGHFLIHMPRPDEPFQCSLADLHLVDPYERDRRKRIEAEANRFAAALLMPPVRVRKEMTSRQPDLGEIRDLAAEFGMSKEAMARAYVEALRHTIAVLVLQHGRIKRVYRSHEFPGMGPWIGDPVPNDSIASDHRLQPRGAVGKRRMRTRGLVRGAQCHPRRYLDRTTPGAGRWLRDAAAARRARRRLSRFGRHSAKASSSRLHYPDS